MPCLWCDPCLPLCYKWYSRHPSLGDRDRDKHNIWRLACSMQHTSATVVAPYVLQTCTGILYRLGLCDRHLVTHAHRQHASLLAFATRDNHHYKTLHTGQENSCAGKALGRRTFAGFVVRILPTRHFMRASALA